MRKKIGANAIAKRVNELRVLREKQLQNVDDLHVKLQKGNVKTGSNCWTVSLAPILDCYNCKECSKDCYDIKNMIYKALKNDRTKNSAIHLVDEKRYWKEIDAQVKANFVTELRLNVGGDLTDTDFESVSKLGRANPKTQIMFFTKNYKGINKFLDSHRFPSNVHPIMSAWLGMEMDNPHNLPCSHVLYEDGTTTAPEYGAKYCGGNCSECAFEGKGCWTLKKGEHVIFKAH